MITEGIRIYSIMNARKIKFKILMNVLINWEIRGIVKKCNSLKSRFNLFGFYHKPNGEFINLPQIAWN